MRPPRRLWRIIRELERKNKTLTYQLNMDRGDLAKICELQAEIENAPWVYGFKGVREIVWHSDKVGGDTHCARLVRIEKLENK